MRLVRAGQNLGWSVSDFYIYLQNYLRSFFFDVLQFSHARLRRDYRSSLSVFCKCFQWFRNSGETSLAWITRCAFQTQTHTSWITVGWGVVCLQQGPLGSCKEGPRQGPHSLGQSWDICPFPVPRTEARHCCCIRLFGIVQQTQLWVLGRHDKDLNQHGRDPALSMCNT